MRTILMSLAGLALAASIQAQAAFPTTFELTPDRGGDGVTFATRGSAAGLSTGPASELLTTWDSKHVEGLFDVSQNASSPKCEFGWLFVILQDSDQTNSHTFYFVGRPNQVVNGKNVAAPDTTKYLQTGSGTSAANFRIGATSVTGSGTGGAAWQIVYSFNNNAQIQLPCLQGVNKQSSGTVGPLQYYGIEFVKNDSWLTNGLSAWTAYYDPTLVTQTSGAAIDTTRMGWNTTTKKPTIENLYWDVDVSSTTFTASQPPNLTPPTGTQSFTYLGEMIYVGLAGNSPILQVGAVHDSATTSRHTSLNSFGIQGIYPDSAIAGSSINKNTRDGFVLRISDNANKDNSTGQPFIVAWSIGAPGRATELGITPPVVGNGRLFLGLGWAILLTGTQTTNNADTVIPVIKPGVLLPLTTGALQFHFQAVVGPGARMTNLASVTAGQK